MIEKNIINRIKLATRRKGVKALKILVNVCHFHVETENKKVKVNKVESLYLEVKLQVKRMISM